MSLKFEKKKKKKALKVSTWDDKDVSATSSSDY
jgi:hypothetical protein